MLPGGIRQSFAYDNIGRLVGSKTRQSAKLRREHNTTEDCDIISHEFVWVFNGEPAYLPSAVFSNKAEAIQWIRDNALSGILTQYPIDIPLFDWAIERDLFTPRNELQRGPKTIANFSSAHLEHYHFTHGKLQG